MFSADPLPYSTWNEILRNTIQAHRNEIKSERARSTVVGRNPFPTPTPCQILKDKIHSQGFH